MPTAVPLAAPAGLSGETRIWHAHLAAISAGELADLESLLDPAERTRAARFRFERDRRHFVAARGILRHLLGEALGVRAQDVLFCYGRNGKPALATGSEPALRFNLSHSGGHAMFALTHGGEIGIDLETAGRLAGRDDELVGLAARVLTTRELAVWRKLPDAAARQAAFLRAWTRKEAYGKATGEGVFDGLTRIEVALDAAAPQPLLRLPCGERAAGGGRTTRSSASAGQVWVIHDLPAPVGFAAALAVAELFAK